MSEIVQELRSLQSFVQALSKSGVEEDDVEVLMTTSQTNACPRAKTYAKEPCKVGHETSGASSRHSGEVWFRMSVDGIVGG